MTPSTDRRTGAHGERHFSHRAGWLRATVLGANDGIISTAALILGVAAADTGRTAVLVAGMSGLISGALSMGLGEYVSVSSQRDSEKADIAREEWELAHVPERELAELTELYQEKGLSSELAHEVAAELTRHDALSTHLVEELGITEAARARPTQAAMVSILSFAVGASLPLLAAAAVPSSSATGIRMVTTIGVAVVALVVLGIVGSRLGGARPTRPTLRTVIGGLIAMAATMAIGKAFGAAIG
jgi:VIT1/CCC1 family predicted Fe2+/Mn2+ transporter